MDLKVFIVGAFKFLVCSNIQILAWFLSHADGTCHSPEVPTTNLGPSLLKYAPSLVYNRPQTGFLCLGGEIERGGGGGGGWFDKITKHWNLSYHRKIHIFLTAFDCFGWVGEKGGVGTLIWGGGELRCLQGASWAHPLINEGKIPPPPSPGGLLHKKTPQKPPKQLW